MEDKNLKIIILTSIIILIVFFLLVIFLLSYYTCEILSIYFPIILLIPGELDLAFFDAEKITNYRYDEIKCLSTQFLTLLTAILVFSVTFSGKIIQFSTAMIYTRTSLTTGWLHLVTTLILNGTSLAFNTFMCPFALSYQGYFKKTRIPRPEFYEPAFKRPLVIIYER